LTLKFRVKVLAAVLRKAYVSCSVKSFGL